VVGEVCENDEKAGIYQKLDTVRITTSMIRDAGGEDTKRHLPVFAVNGPRKMLWVLL